MEGSGRVWRQEEVPAFPPEPSPTPLTRCCQHTLVYKEVTRFCLARHLWTSLYNLHVKNSRKLSNFLWKNYKIKLHLRYSSLK